MTPAAREKPGPVGSSDEWSPLREVIVGTPYHLDYHADLSFRLFFHRNLTVPLRWRRGRSLGGGFHCVTLDIRRDSPPGFSI